MSFGFYAFWFVNLAEIVLCLWDKFCARTHRWRVPERVFFTLAFLGGALGLGAGMLIAHHKVSKPSFVRIAVLAGLNLIALLAVILATSNNFEIVFNCRKICYTVDNVR